MRLQKRIKKRKRNSISLWQAGYYSYLSNRKRYDINNIPCRLCKIKKGNARYIMKKRIEQTISSIEVAEMVNKKHSELLKDIRKYKEQLNEVNIPFVDFFRESTYKDGKGEMRPCYTVTKKGCEFIAHKLTGIKGTEFTARYINRFHEMEDKIGIISAEIIPVGEVAKLTNIMDRIAVRQNLAPHKIAENFKIICEQFGIRLMDDFVKVPEYEQLKLKME